MAGSSSPEDNPVGINVTALVDVIFCHCLFFMCSLHFKQVGRFWSVRVGLHYRAVAVEQEGNMLWFWIGGHADYDRLLGQV